MFKVIFLPNCRSVGRVRSIAKASQLRIERLGESIVVNEVVEQFGAGWPKQQVVRPKYLC